MKSVTLTIQCDNAAFDGGPEHEVARILRDTADKLDAYEVDEQGLVLRDFNGNTVGHLTVENEEE